MKRDIENEQDIQTFVDGFYSKVTKDDLLGPIFNDIAKVNWPHHLPTMYSFWSMLLFGTKNYTGMPFPKHFAIRRWLSAAHFERWVALFAETVDSLFEGPLTEDAKRRASTIASIFKTRLGVGEQAELLPIAS